MSEEGGIPQKRSDLRWLYRGGKTLKKDCVIWRWHSYCKTSVYRSVMGVFFAKCDSACMMTDAEIISWLQWKSAESVQVLSTIWELISFSAKLFKQTIWLRVEITSQFISKLHNGAGSQFFHGSKTIHWKQSEPRPSWCHKASLYTTYFTSVAVKQEKYSKLWKKISLFTIHLTKLFFLWLWNPFFFSRGMCCHLSNQSTTWDVNSLWYLVSDGANIQTL